jgi:hypothetical protein
MMPDKIGGKPEKSGFSLTVVSGKPRRGMPDKIGGDPSEYEDESGDQDMSPEQVKDDAVGEIIASITSVKPNPKRLKEALRAFVQSCNGDIGEGNEGESEEESE